MPASIWYRVSTDAWRSSSFAQEMRNRKYSRLKQNSSIARSAPDTGNASRK